MAPRVLILGAGTAGTMTANRLRHRLPRRSWDITVVDRDDRHHYQPGFLFIPFGMYYADQVTRSRQAFLDDGITLVFGEIREVEPELHQVQLEDGRTVPYDYYTLEGATELAAALERCDHGRLVVHVTEMPIKCPVAPLEFTFLADAWLRDRGLRDRVERIDADRKALGVLRRARSALRPAGERAAQHGRRIHCALGFG